MRAFASNAYSSYKIAAKFIVTFKYIFIARYLTRTNRTELGSAYIYVYATVILIVDTDAVFRLAAGSLPK